MRSLSQEVLTIKRVPSAPAVVVLAVLLALSGAAWWVVHGGVVRQERAVLKEETSHAVLLLQGKVEAASQLLGSVGVGSTVFDANAKALRSRPDITVVLVTRGRADANGYVTPGPPRVSLVVGPGLHPGELLTGRLAKIALAARSSVSSSPVIELAGKRCVVLSVVPPAIGLPGYVALDILPLIHQQTSLTNGPFGNLDVAVYATPTAQPSELIASTTGHAALPQPTASTELRVGSLEWAAVGAARAPLLDSSVEASPWIVLGVGLLLAAVLAFTVDSLIRRQREQRTVAETLQTALLPDELPQTAAAEAAVIYRPGVEGIHVGGDWYDVIVLDERRLLAVVGDVSGRGLNAAGVMATLLYSTRAYAADGYPPAEILAKLSRLLSVERSGHFATALLVLIDLEDETIEVVSGGHPPPLLLHDRQVEYINVKNGPPVGVSSTPTYAAVTVPVSPGDTLLAFTDGLVERRGESVDVGLDRLRQAAVAEEAGSLDALVSNLVESLVGRGVGDDTILLGFRWKDPKPTEAPPVDTQRAADEMQAPV